MAKVHLKGLRADVAHTGQQAPYSTYVERMFFCTPVKSNVGNAKPVYMKHQS